MLILASQSKIRRTLLENAGVRFETQVSPLDEETTKQFLGPIPPQELAQELAQAKAAAVAKLNRDAIIIGADQTMELNGKVFHKPSDKSEANAQLRELRGQKHELHSAVAVVRGTQVLFRNTLSARLKMRNFSDSFLDRYLTCIPEEILLSVGCYQLESLGIQLFDHIEGDYHAILGLPLLPLLVFLRDIGEVDT
jgi:septum formation protein